MDCDNYIGITSDFLCIAIPQPPTLIYNDFDVLINTIYPQPVTNAIGCCSINKPNSVGKWYCLLGTICQILDCNNPFKKGVNSQGKCVGLNTKQVTRCCSYGEKIQLGICINQQSNTCVQVNSNNKFCYDPIDFYFCYDLSIPRYQFSDPDKYKYIGKGLLNLNCLLENEEDVSLCRAGSVCKIIKVTG